MSGSTSNAGGVAAGTREASQTPFASDSVFNLPIGSNAQWTPNAQLAQGQPFVNTTASGWNSNIYTGTAGDPLITVTSTGARGGPPGTFQVHVPASAVPAGGTDNPISIDDTTTGTWYSFGGFQRTGPNTATAQQGAAEPDNGNGLGSDNSNWDSGVGAITETDLQSGNIDHTMSIAIPTTMALSYSSTSTSALAPNAWPQTQEDGYAISGNGGPAYSGTVPYGVTVGIPAGTSEPGDVAANAGANMLWRALMDHGAMIRNTGGSGNEIVFTADQNVNGYDPLIQGMDQYGSEIFHYVQILGNQGPNSVNGGGTPIVALDPPLSDGSTTSSTAASSDTAAITPQTLSSGSSSQTSSSGMTFIASSGSGGTSASTTNTTSGTSGASADPSTNTASGASPGATASASDFTTPVSSGTSSSASQPNGSGGGYGSYFTTHHAHAAAIVTQQS